MTKSASPSPLKSAAERKTSPAGQVNPPANRLGSEPIASAPPHTGPRQWRFSQKVPVVHRNPHTPQLSLSLLSATHSLPQRCLPLARQESVHCATAQV